ncbi:MAG: serine hydrolase [Bacteroidota bacterium]
MKYLLTFLFSLCVSLHAQNLYFPPIQGNAWDTITPESLGWCQPEIDSLYELLEAQNTKAFLVLKDGKMALEKYFGSFDQDSVWYWASAGKTVTAFLVGKAQEEGFLSISDPTSDYLGKGWSSCAPTQEDSITIWHQLTMTTGLDDNVPNVDCIDDTCLQYLAPVGTRWAYHNGPYTLLSYVVESATNNTYQAYTRDKLFAQTGMRGFWLPLGYNRTFFSNARSMARFGLLMLNGGRWDNVAVMQDTIYFNSLANTSQVVNPSYGYLWWLNGKSNFMLPGSQFSFPGFLLPNAPADLYAAMGKNGQFVIVVPSQNLVMIRMGNAPSNSLVPAALLRDIWDKFEALSCNPTSIEVTENVQPAVYPNPATQMIRVVLPKEWENPVVSLKNIQGKVIASEQGAEALDVSSLPAGLYLLEIRTQDKAWVKKVQVLN